MGERQFGPYRLVEQIAVGGMAEIYLAKTRGIAGFEKYVALKMIHPNFSEDEQFIQMLIDEAKITVLLQHVNIAQTFDLGKVGSTYYITMEFVDGADLYKLLRKGSEVDLDVPVDVAAYIAKEVATGLDYAHRKRDISGKKLGIVHRDVSPQNVLISHNGEVKLVDFGIAKATMRARQTAVGVIKGKYYYMSPEQAWGESVDRRTDIFSAGILLYEMLTGQMLYLEEDLHKLLDMVRRADVAPPTTLRKDVPPQLERIVMRALAKNREDRYQTANELATDLERFLHVYSPVFRAPKVSDWITKVLGSEEEEEEEPDPTEPPSERFRSAITDEQLVRERSEITDENSIIFDLRDLKKPEASAEAPPVQQGAKRSIYDETGEVDRPASFPGASKAGAAQGRDLPALPKLSTRGIDQETKNVGANVEQMLAMGPGGGLAPAASGSQHADELGEDDESTVISDAPFFPAPTPGLSPAPAPAPASTYRDAEQVTKPAVDRAALYSNGNSPARPAPSKFLGDVKTIPDAQPDFEDGPTLRREPSSPAFLPSKTITEQVEEISLNEPVPASKQETRKRHRTNPPPVPPAALAAANPAPAVSKVRPPRRSRRTPAGGVPKSGSVLSKLVNQSGVNAGPTGMPVSRDPNPDRDMELQVPAPLPPGAQAQITQGFESAARDGTTAPFGGMGGRSPFGQLPAGAPPLSTANRLVALEVDDIPDAFKLSHQAAKRRKRAITGVVVLAVCVMLGVGLGMVLFKAGPEVPKTKSLEVVSIPAGATVTIDGKAIEGVTPLVYEGLAVGKSYLIGVDYPGHKPWLSETEVTADVGGGVKVIARLEMIVVKLMVDSKPPGAQVLINGSAVGLTPVTLEELDPRTTKNIELRRRGYRPIRQELDWTKDTEKSLTFELKR